MNQTALHWFQAIMSAIFICVAIYNMNTKEEQPTKVVNNYYVITSSRDSLGNEERKLYVIGLHD